MNIHLWASALRSLGLCIALAAACQGVAEAASRVLGQAHRSNVIAPAQANLWVDTNGGTCFRQVNPGAYADAQACSSIAAAWNAAGAGDIIVVKAGTYGAQAITGNKAAETRVIGENGVTIGDIDSNGSFFTLENMAASGWSSRTAGVHDITLRNVNISGNNGVFLDAENARNIKWIGGSLRNFSCANCPTAMAVYAGETIGGTATVTDFLIDGVTFDNNRNTGGTGNHFEAIRIDGNVNGFTLRNSTFTNIDATSSTLFFTTFRGNKPRNIVLENNFFSPPGDAFFVINENFQGSSCTNWAIRYNTFQSAAATVFNCSESSTVVWTGNLALSAPNEGGNCQGGSFVSNVWYGSGFPCSSSDRVITSAGLGGSGGFHLQSGSGAIDSGGTGANCIASDHDGDARPVGPACDAGADEASGNTDAVPPVVSFSFPVTGATVSGILLVSAAASDNVGVTKVEFYVDGVLRFTDTASRYRYAFDTRTLTNASHTLTARAYDAANNSSAVNVTIVTVNSTDVIAPTAPTNLTAIAAGATTINLAWTAATDNVGVTRYNIVRNGIIRAQINALTTTYSDSGRTSNTTYRYTIQAVDGANNTSANSNSAAVTTPTAAVTIASTVPAHLGAPRVLRKQVHRAK